MAGNQEYHTMGLSQIYQSIDPPANVAETGLARHDGSISDDISKIATILGLDTQESWKMDPENRETIDFSYRDNAYLYFVYLENQQKAIQKSLIGDFDFDGALQKLGQAMLPGPGSKKTLGLKSEIKKVIPAFDEAIAKHVSSIQGSNKAQANLTHLARQQDEIMFRVENMITNFDKILEGLGYDHIR